MTSLAELVFGLSVLWLVYAYFGYPALLWALARACGPGPEPHARSGPPSVTILTAAYNEAAVIGENLRNKLDLDYPAALLDIIVISDESTDGTDQIVEQLAAAHPGRIRLIRQSPRQGKTAGLNRAVPQARGEILVFADANSIYEPDALRHLVGKFADPRIGYVTGKMIYTNADGSVSGDGCSTYMRYENRMRAWETLVGSVVGVDGGIDAVRRELYKPMRADQLPDFVLPLRVVEQGYRVAYEPRAVLREPSLTSPGQEYRMRVRVALRAMWALWDLRQLFDPLHDPRFSWQLTSHKLLRYLAFLPQIGALLSNAALWGAHPTWRLLLLGQICFYALATFGYVVNARGMSFPPATIPYYFTLLNLACLHAFGRFVRGQKQVLWQPRTG